MFFKLPFDIGIKTIVWIPAMIFLAIIGTLFLIKTRKTSKEVPSQRSLFRAMSIFCYLYIGTRFFFMLSDFEREPHGETLLYFRFVAIAYIFGIIGYLNFVYAGEKYIIKQTKYIMTYFIIIMLIVDIIMVFFPDLMGIVRFINYGLFYFEGFAVLLLYAHVYKKNSGRLRKNALLAVIGLITIASAALLEMDILITSGLVVPYYSPLLVGIGVSIFAYSQRGL